VSGSRSGINHFSIWEFISSQTNNRYTSSKPPYVVHIEFKENMGNIGNLHPMKLGKMLANSFSFIKPAAHDACFPAGLLAF